MTSPLSAVVLEYYGGAAGRVPNDATAYPHRDLPWDILFIAQWTDPSETATHRDWARSGEESFGLSLRTPICFPHSMSKSEEVINTAFGANLPRLAAVKKKYDPANFFRVNHNIKPELARAGAA